MDVGFYPVGVRVLVDLLIPPFGVAASIGEQIGSHAYVRRSSTAAPDCAPVRALTPVGLRNDTKREKGPVSHWVLLDPCVFLVDVDLSTQMYNSRVCMWQEVSRSDRLKIVRKYGVG
jgi:hypothetical protein